MARFHLTRTNFLGYACPSYFAFQARFQIGSMMLESSWKLVLAGAGPGLQNRCAALRASQVGSTPTSFRHRAPDRPSAARSTPANPAPHSSPVAGHGAG